MRYHQIINEMIIRHQASSPDILIAFKDSIWMVDIDDVDEQIINEICQKTGISNIGFIDFQEVEEHFDERQDVLVARIYNGVLSINRYRQLNPVTSKLIKKVVAQTQFSVSKEYDDDELGEIDNNYYEFHGEIPSIAFHGTSAQNSYRILKYGLRSNQKGNWQDLHFPDRVFLSSDVLYTFYHANRTAEKNNSVPVIFVFSIPDKSKIDQDYDVGVEFYGKDHPDLPEIYRSPADRNKWSNSDEVQKHSPKTNFTRETGVFSYKGRIPASFIKSVIVAPDEGHIGPENMLKLSPSEYIENMDDYSEFGIYDPVMFDEMRKNMEDGD